MIKPIRILSPADESLLRSDQERRAVEFVGSVIAHCHETNLYASALNTLVQTMIEERKAMKPRKRRHTNDQPPIMKADVLDLCRQLDEECAAKNRALAWAAELEDRLLAISGKQPSRKTAKKSSNKTK